MTGRAPGMRGLLGEPAGPGVGLLVDSEMPSTPEPDRGVVHQTLPGPGSWRLPRLSKGA